jgi:hypothetical protein
VTPPVDPSPSTGLRDLAILAACAVLGLVALGWWLQSETGAGGSRRQVVTLAAPRRIGDRFLGLKTCRECHLDIATKFAGSGHAATLRPAASSPAAEFLTARAPNRPFDDPEQPGVTWSYSTQGANLVTERRAGPEAIPTRDILAFAFGSGHHATTFVTPTQDKATGLPMAFEHRLTYFAHRHGLAVTPGQEGYDPASGTTERGRFHSPTSTYLCFGCHSTITSADDLNRLDLETLVPNVTCERCHGPGYEHVRDARNESPDLLMPNGRAGGPQGWTTDSLLKLCGGCHRHPAVIDPTKITPDTPDFARFQPVGLMRSNCFTQSDGRLQCLTCHDPHGPADSRPATYERICLSCHGSAHPGQKPCPTDRSDGCVACHMPRRDAGQGVEFTDHWIRVVPPALPPRPAPGPETSPSRTDRNVP